ncbi:MAG: glycosyltransferase family 2 protein [Elusimicrobia bacterium]|nr:glycosyltransferase family 2 protein [Elusimicrobiota bacterium]
MSRVCASVLVRNGRDVVEPCLESLLRQKLPGGSVEIVALDNGSEDGSGAFLRKLQKRWPRLIVKSSPANMGFAPGHNAVLKENAQRYDYFLLVNQDARLEGEDCLARLVEAARKLGDEALIQPLVLDLSGRPVSAGLELAYTGAAAPTLEPVQSGGSAPVEIAAVHAVVLLISRRALDKVGFLEDSYFAYHEDVEYSLRARLHGVRSWCVPSARAFHDQLPERFRKNFFAQYLMERNRYRYLLSYFSWPLLLALLPALLVQEAAMLAWFGLCGNLAGKSRGWKETALDWDRIMALRRAGRELLRVSAFRRDFYLAHGSGVGARRILADPGYPLWAKAGTLLVSGFLRLYGGVYKLLVLAACR